MLHYSLLEPLDKSRWDWMTKTWKVTSDNSMKRLDGLYRSHRQYIPVRQSIVKDDSSQTCQDGYWHEHKVAWVQTWDDDFWYRKTGQFSPCEEKLGMMPKPMVKPGEVSSPLNPSAISTWTYTQWRTLHTTCQTSRLQTFVVQCFRRFMVGYRNSRNL